jgi:hypothetical protein
MEKAMRPITKYVSEDGQEFCTEEECVYHEMLQGTKTAIKEALSEDEGVALGDSIEEMCDIVEKVSMLIVNNRQEFIRILNSENEVSGLLDQ